jgi:hypothetical protein
VQLRRLRSEQNAAARLISSLRRADDLTVMLRYLPSVAPRVGANPV